MFFTPEVQCVNETQKYLRKLIHEVGLELRTTAVCSGVRRTRDGLFKVENALARQHWTTDNIIQAIVHFRSATRKIRKSGIYRQTAAQSNTSTGVQEQKSKGRDDAQNLSCDTMVDRESPDIRDEERTKC